VLSVGAYLMTSYQPLVHDQLMIEFADDGWMKWDHQYATDSVQGIKPVHDVPIVKLIAFSAKNINRTLCCTNNVQH
jgi:hypothetical protein